ncbi:hypothetical protein HO173_004296 [Letharia columbiana]|uniref:peptidylprolyl isomerase n=1 Tax=Letharia columbiana TaxID=112416 RepID=A0A8H6L6K2_9LECA|nr:uncharacterized protein HO173_004296 [Letharia columbiana]KAF6237406.1 hypothetical protein HO173_004296 [Letharia columbiana]
MSEFDEKLQVQETGSGHDVKNDEKIEETEIFGEVDEEAEEEAREKLRREREARAQALTLEIVGDLPYAEVKPPENVLFVCKLNPVTEDEDLDTIFSRFGPIVSCEVIRDKRTKDSLQYAFIEFENQKDCEQAYFKMQGVLIDDHRIHVDFSQSVSRLSDKWRTATNSKRAQHGGGFGGIAGLEKKRQFRAIDPKSDEDRKRSNGYGMVIDKNAIRHERDKEPDRRDRPRKHSRSRSPRSHDRYRERVPSGDVRRRRDRSRDYQRDDYEDRSRRR